MESAKLRTVNLTDNDLAKDHLRYFVSCIFHILLANYFVKEINCNFISF
jgi:hypothetical protein